MTASAWWDHRVQVRTPTTVTGRAVTGRAVTGRAVTGLRMLLTACLLVVLLAALVGLRLALPMLLHPGEQAALDALLAPGSAGIGVGTPVRTSFGSLTVGEVVINDGLSPADLGGMTHGVSSMVGAGSAQVNVVVTLWNHDASPAALTASQFSLVREGAAGPAGAPLPAVGTTLPRTPVPSGASLDTRLTFVTPSDGSGLSLQFADGDRPVLRVPLGSTDRVAAPVDGHAH